MYLQLETYKNTKLDNAPISFGIVPLNLLLPKDLVIQKLTYINYSTNEHTILVDLLIEISLLECFQLIDYQLNI